MINKVSEAIKTIRVIEIVKKFFKKWSIHFCYSYHFYRQKIISNPFFLKLLSKWKGISIAEKYKQTIKIKYMYEGKEFEVYLPYERKLVSKMINQTLHVIDDDCGDMIIKHQPGVPYLFTPGHFNANKAILVNLNNQKLVNKNERIES
jgi:hypothetical protein